MRNHGQFSFALSYNHQVVSSAAQPVDLPDAARSATQGLVVSHRESDLDQLAFAPVTVGQRTSLPAPHRLRLPARSRKHDRWLDIRSGQPGAQLAGMANAISNATKNPAPRRISQSPAEVGPFRISHVGIDQIVHHILV